MLFTNKKEETADTNDNVDKPYRHTMLSERSQIQEYDFIHMSSRIDKSNLCK